MYEKWFAYRVTTMSCDLSSPAHHHPLLFFFLFQHPPAGCDTECPEGEDNLVVMATGAGKSLCYQVSVEAVVATGWGGDLKRGSALCMDVTRFRLHDVCSQQSTQHATCTHFLRALHTHLTSDCIATPFKGLLCLGP